jgi:hypothetical protein
MPFAEHDPDPMKRLAFWLLNALMSERGLTEEQAKAVIAKSSVRLIEVPDGGYRVFYRESLDPGVDVIRRSDQNPIAHEAA